jgi:hypothetical protein
MMIKHGYYIGLLVVLLAGGCSPAIRGSIKVATPLTQDLNRPSMAVHFTVAEPALQEGLNAFKPVAMAQIRAAGIAQTATEVPSISPPPATDLILSVNVTEYVKSNVGFLVRGAFAKQAKIIMGVSLTDPKTNQVLTAGAVGAWTFKNKPNALVDRRAAENLRRFLNRQYNAEQ